jgi:hypothetical protein
MQQLLRCMVRRIEWQPGGEHDGLPAQPHRLFEREARVVEPPLVEVVSDFVGVVGPDDPGNGRTGCTASPTRRASSACLRYVT